MWKTGLNKNSQAESAVSTILNPVLIRVINEITSQKIADIDEIYYCMK